MYRALYRKAMADLKSQRLQYSLIFVILAAATMMLSLTLIVQRSADDPWERVFEETVGPHVWLVSDDADLDFSSVTASAEVVATTPEIFAVTNHPLVIDDEKYDMFLYAMGERPPIARPKVAEGRWLNPNGVDEIVLDYSLALYFDFSVGDMVEILTAGGNRPLRVVGLAVTSHFVPFSETMIDLVPGMAYVLPDTLEAIEPNQEAYYKALGLRLENPESSADFIRKAHVLLNNRLYTAIDWQWTRQMTTFSNQISVLFLGFLSLIGLVAVGFIIANAIGGHVLANYRDIGLLKAIGFKPNQVLLLYLAQNLGVGLIAAAIGLAAGIAIAPVFTSPIAELLNSTPPSAANPALAISVLAFVGLAVMIFTIIPAWHGSRIDTARAITVGYTRRHIRPSRFARWARELRLPPVIVLGVKDSFARPLRAILTILGLVLTISVVIIAVGFDATLSGFTEDSMYYQGTAADLRVNRSFVPNATVQALLADHPAIVRYYTEFITYGFAPNRTEPITQRILSDDYAAFDFNVAEGRMVERPGEAVVGHGVLQLLDMEIGDDIMLIVGGRPLVLTIVGRHLEILNLGRVVLLDLETYRQQIDSNAEPQYYALDVADGTDREALRDALVAQSDGQFDVLVTNTEVNPSVNLLQSVIFSLATLLTVIAAVNLLSASMLGVRERVRDFGIEKTLGLTPRQIAISVTAGVCALALVALVVGIPLGLVLFGQIARFVGEQIGAGADFARMNWLALVLVLPGMGLLALISSLIPARRAAQMEVADALRYE